MKQNEKLLLTSFLFTIFVVWLHAGEPLFSYVPGQVAVPGFFMLSGYLFLQGIPSDDKAREREVITGKLRRRAKTLVIPYLLWNAIYFVIYLATGRAQLSEVFEAVFLYRCNPVFWYMFQLILITILAPALYFIMKKGRAAALVTLAAIFALAVFYAKLPFHYCNEDALFYYALGGYLMLRERYGAQTADRCRPAYCEDRSFSSFQSGECEGVQDVRGTSALHRPEWNGESECEQDPERIRPAYESLEKQDRNSGAGGTCLPSVLCIGVTAVFLLVRGVLPADLRNISEVGYRAAGALAVYFLVDLVWEKRGGVEIKPWMKINFFVYATHYMLIRIVWALETAAGLNGSQTANIITYLVMPVICISAAYGLSVIMKKYVPKVYSVLTGGR